ncbi:ribosome maturation factor RimM [Alphaproteobacteria bacterium]|nr:ribosome maturation factor RimM [Alphaproteobacteria bacterium]
MSEKRVCVGTISRPIGLQGFVRIKPYTSSPDFFVKNSSFFLSDDTAITLTNQKINEKNEIIAAIDGVNNRTDIEKFKSQKLFVAKNSLQNLEEDEYYFDDLVELDIFNEKNENIGKVLAVLDYGAGTFLDIKLNNEKNIATISFNKDSILSVNIAENFIKINEEFIIK